MTDPERAAGVLRRLHELGVRISIDDFGAGYSSLAYLRLLPVSALKLDRTLITHLLDRPADLAVTETLISLGHRLGLEVLAEGVETEVVQALLLDLGCDQAQGYGISRPLAPEPMVAFLSGEPFYGESSFLTYRKDVFGELGLATPERPTWPQQVGPRYQGR